MRKVPRFHEISVIFLMFSSKNWYAMSFWICGMNTRCDINEPSRYPCITTRTCEITRSTDRQPKHPHTAAIKFSKESFIDKVVFHSKAPNELWPMAKITHVTCLDKGEGKPSGCVPSQGGSRSRHLGLTEEGNDIVCYGSDQSKGSIIELCGSNFGYIFLAVWKRKSHH